MVMQVSIFSSLHAYVWRCEGASVRIVTKNSVRVWSECIV